jgi:hypothetical protein
VSDSAVKIFTAVKIKRELGFPLGFSLWY